MLGMTCSAAAEELTALRRGVITAAVYTIGMRGHRLGDGAHSSGSDEAWDEVLRVDLTCDRSSGQQAVLVGVIQEKA
jgi:hypothetical protein